MELAHHRRVHGESDFWKPSLKGRDLKWLNDGWMKNVYNGCRMVVGIALFLSCLNWGCLVA